MFFTLGSLYRNHFFGEPKMVLQWHSKQKPSFGAFNVIWKNSNSSNSISLPYMGKITSHLIRVMSEDWLWQMGLVWLCLERKPNVKIDIKSKLIKKLLSQSAQFQFWCSYFFFFLFNSWQFKSCQLLTSSFSASIHRFFVV